jgi:hypothetical protein
VDDVIQRVSGDAAERPTETDQYPDHVSTLPDRDREGPERCLRLPVGVIGRPGQVGGWGGLHRHALPDLNADRWELCLSHILLPTLRPSPGVSVRLLE